MSGCLGVAEILACKSGCKLCSDSCFICCRGHIRNATSFVDRVILVQTDVAPHMIKVPTTIPIHAPQLPRFIFSTPRSIRELQLVSSLDCNKLRPLYRFPAHPLASTLPVACFYPPQPTPCTRCVPTYGCHLHTHTHTKLSRRGGEALSLIHISEPTRPY